jgi:CheY-like chemotaxis protein
MNAETPSILSGKRILFVEDRPQTLEFFIDELRHATRETVRIDNAENLAEAVRLVRDESDGYDMVVIDLHMPGKLPEALQPYRSIVRPELNEGQILGIWLHAERGEIPYVYLSSVPDAYRPIATDTPALREPLNKFELSPWEFPDRLATAIEGSQRLREEVV